MFYTATIAFTFFQLMNISRASSPSSTYVMSDAHHLLYQDSGYPTDCKDLQRQCLSERSSGVHLIKPYGSLEPFEVFCNNDVDSGGWTVIQRREDGIVNFNRSWAHYRDGFGFLSTEFFIGNEKLAHLTNQADYELLVEVELEDGCLFYTSYKGFRITDEFGQYTLQHADAFDSNKEQCLTDCPSDEFFINTCREVCVCNSNRLESCSAIGCDNNAMCEIKNGVEMCSCNDGYEGDGLTCRLKTTTAPGSRYRDCKEVYDDGNTQDGVYEISPNEWTGPPFDVFCKMNNGEGWTVFQRRKDDTQSFHQNWDLYKRGFGDLRENFWLGNEKLYYLTTQKHYLLRLDITTSGGTSLNAEYLDFQIESEHTNYTMNDLGTRSSSSGAGNWLFQSVGQQFSTYDRDNDRCAIYNCAEKHTSAWWHGPCTRCGGTHFSNFRVSSNCNARCTNENLNGDFNGGNGENIYSFNVGSNLRFVEMGIRPAP